MVAAAITAVATVGGAVISSNASKNAANKAAGSAKANNALQEKIYNQNTANLSPWMTRGNAAGGAVQNLLGLGTNPAAAEKAFDAYRGSTGYQFRLDQGNEAVTQNRAVSGLLKSGSALKALTKYGQNIASDEFGNYLGQLNSVSGQGLSAANALAGVGTGYADAVGRNNDSAATAAGNAALANANNVNNLIGQGVSAYGMYRGQSSYGAPSYGTPPFNGNYGYTGGNMGGLY